MPTTTTTHLNFRGEARQALEFYRSVSGGELTIVTYGDLDAAQEPAQADQVMWGQVLAPGGFHVMAYDVQAAKPFDRGQNSFYIALRSETAEETQALWDDLSDAATVIQPLGEAPWSASYGMLTDRFGITWVLDVESEHQGSPDRYAVNPRAGAASAGTQNPPLAENRVGLGHGSAQTPPPRTDPRRPRGLSARLPARHPVLSRRGSACESPLGETGCTRAGT